MAGIYIHIPFCKQRCSYCDFHFSTSYQSYRSKLIDTICEELVFRKDELNGEVINSVYFGGGTPSLLNSDELKSIQSTISANYLISSSPEITLEANPDDMSVSNLKDWRNNGINRLSVGIQSFRDNDLKWMNRAHTAEHAENCVKDAQQFGFNAISVDLIYGLPSMDLSEWNNQIEKAISLNIQHISAYCLTVEQKTQLHKLVEKGEVVPGNEDHQSEQFLHLLQVLKEKGFEQYEISNFCIPGFEAVHNSSYWKGEKYIGIGPSAHSFDGTNRRWNISNNALYMKLFKEEKTWYEKEELTGKDRFNELLLTGLRTKYGVNLSALQSNHSLTKDFIQKIENYANDGWMQKIEGTLLLTDEGKLRADYIASELFI